ncbi:MAG: NAD(+)/NADH kinase [Chlamydiales bacterium]|nr:NAD(+)/NADH kinase [Chlamydiales bacterium]
MMIVALFPNTRKPQTKNIAIGIREYLASRGITVVVEDAEAEELNLQPLSSVDPKEISFLISLGGDGTILRLIHRHSLLEVPIIGINMGSLGFLADVPVSDIYPSLQDLIDGRYRIQKRMIMEGETVKGETCFAINEMVFHRAQNPSLVDLGVHVDGIYLNTFSADGVIVATPSGSTAYSLAAGGPILTPELNSMVITPICPHTVSNRPIVLMPQKEIQIQHLSEHDPVEITFDGISRYSIRTGEVFYIRPSKRFFPLISLDRHDYFSTLRTKLGWTGKLRT